METEESSVDDTPYDPIEYIEMNNEGIETLVNDQFLMELIDLDVADSSQKHSCFFLFSSYKSWYKIYSN
jgi:hypothetical protein